jgi:hypothetical protein
MLEKIACCLILALPICLRTSQAQENFIAEGKTSILVFDNNGKPFENPASDIAGTPFLLEDWHLGSVTLQNNRRFDSVRLRLNLATQQIHFMDQNNQEIALFKGFVKAIRFYDILPGTNNPTEFQTGFPAIDQQDETNFYQVISKGKIFLLKFMHKIVSQEKNELSGEIKKEYVGYEDYYVYNGKEMQRVKKDKSAILSLLADQQAKVQSFIDTNHLRLKSVDEVKRVIDYYNSL